MKDEIWKPIVGYEGFYEVSNFGRIRSIEHFVNHSKGGKKIIRSKVMNPYTDEDGHKRIKLCKMGKGKKHYVHNLVTEAFIGPKPSGYATAHGNGIPDDNRLENLRYATFAENEADKLIHGRHVRGEGNWNSKLTSEQVYRIREVYDYYMANHKSLRKSRILYDLAEEIGMRKKSIYQIGTRASWAWLPERNNK